MGAKDSWWKGVAVWAAIIALIALSFQFFNKQRKEEQIKYLPLQAQEGDLAIFLQKGAIEVMYEEERYFIVPQASILMLEREEDL